MALIIVVTTAGAFIGEDKGNDILGNPFQMVPTQDQRGRVQLTFTPPIFGKFADSITIYPEQIVYTVEPDKAQIEAHADSLKNKEAAKAGIQLAKEQDVIQFIKH